MKLIFLDHDGVICLAENWGSRFKKPGYTSDPADPLDVRMDNFNQKAIDVLNKILEETDAEIVISSDWKLHSTLEQMQEMYRVRGIKKVPISMTQRLSDFDSESAAFFQWKGMLEACRILEIEKWIADHSEITHWVAVDDLNMSPEYNRGHGLSNFVLTPRVNEGIKQIGIKQKIVSFLK